MPRKNKKMRKLKKISTFPNETFNNAKSVSEAKRAKKIFTT